MSDDRASRRRPRRSAEMLAQGMIPAKIHGGVGNGRSTCAADPQLGSPPDSSPLSTSIGRTTASLGGGEAGRSPHSPAIPNSRHATISPR